MKKVLSIFFVVIIISALAVVPFSAAEKGAKLVDDKNYLTSEQASDITNKLNSITENYNMDAVIVLIPSLNGESKVIYADDYYDYNGYKNDGLLLLLSIEDREWYISTKGYGITAFTDYGIQAIGKELTGYLKKQDYYGACDEFTSLADEFIREAKNGNPYDTNHKRRDLFDILFAVGIAFVVGLIIAIVVVIMVKKSYKPVQLKAEANDYLVKDSLVVKNGYDNFLYTHVTRTRRADKDGGGSSTHTSSSGSSHGGGGGSW